MSGQAWIGFAAPGSAAPAEPGDGCLAPLAARGEAWVQAATQKLVASAVTSEAPRRRATEDSRVPAMDRFNVAAPKE
jgi:hypothetical protein